MLLLQASLGFRIMFKWYQRAFNMLDLQRNKHVPLPATACNCLQLPTVLSSERGKWKQ